MGKKSKFDELSEHDWRWAVGTVTGLNDAEIDKILSDNGLSFESDGFRACEKAVLKHGRAALRNRPERLN